MRLGVGVGIETRVEEGLRLGVGVGVGIETGVEGGLRLGVGVGVGWELSLGWRGD